MKKAYCPNCGEIEDVIDITHDMPDGGEQHFSACPRCGHEVYIRHTVTSYRRSIDLETGRQVEETAKKQLKDLAKSLGE